MPSSQLWKSYLFLIMVKTPKVLNKGSPTKLYVRLSFFSTRLARLTYNHTLPPPDPTVSLCSMQIYIAFLNIFVKLCKKIMPSGSRLSTQNQTI